MKLKRLLALFVGIALIMFFTLPSMLFGEPGDVSTSLPDAPGIPASGQYEMEPKTGDPTGDNDSYSDPEESIPDSSEHIETYCLDEDVSRDRSDEAYIETDIDVSDELEANGVDPVDAEAVEIMATTATGASNSDNQEAVWDIIRDDTSPPGSTVEAIVDAVTAIAGGFVADVNEFPDDVDPTLQEYLDEINVNELDVTLEHDPLVDPDPLVDSNGDYNEFEATAIMENPLVPEVTDKGKTVFWYILEGSYNVSFSEFDLITEETSTMTDKVDVNDATDEDGDGNKADDHYGFATIPYYFYWWGGDYPEFEEMSVNIGACVDIDEDGDIDKEKGEDLDEFNLNANVVQTIVDGSQHIVETSGGNVVTAIPDNIDIDYFNAGKMVVTEKEDQDGELSTYKDAWIPYSYKETSDSQNIIPPHWVNGAPGIVIPAGFYYINEEWQYIGSWVWYRSPIDQRFVIESYSEPCDGDSETYSAWGSFEVLKTDSETDNPVEGAVYKLTYISGQTNTPDPIPVYTLTTGADGKASVSGLLWGTYELKEFSSPSGYGLDPNAYAVLIGGTALFEEGGSIETGLNVQNDPQERSYGSITVIKRDETGATMDGVGFTLYYKDSGNQVMPEQFTSGGLVTFSGLAWNTYIVKETTPPPGYDTSDPVEVTINAANAEAGVTITRVDTKTPPRRTPPPPGGGEITVLGIQELPFTGMNPAIPISGISTLFAGGLMVVLSTIRKRFGRK